MTSSMNRKALRVAGIVLSALVAAACDETRDGEGGDKEDVAEAPQAEKAAPSVEAAADDASAVELERLLRRVERGEATKADAEALTRIIAEAKLPIDALDRASLALSTALNKNGDREGAVRAVEDLMKRHGGDSTFEAHDAARNRLRLLLTGTETEPPSYAQNMEPVAAVAKNLVSYFPEDARGATIVDVLTVGRAPKAGDPHGILNLRAAKRQIEEEACSVCDINIKVGLSHSRVDSWAELPIYAGERRAEMANPDRSLVIVYFDLSQNRVPSRYDAYLAVPSDETVERLERGEAFVAVRERPGKKPVVLLAAPRAYQLAEVEKTFADMTSIPTAPVVVEVPKKLQPPEIQGIVRGGFGRFRVCYETLLKVDPKAAGKVTLKFKIDGAGLPQGVSTESTMSDPQVSKCIAEQMTLMRFPATGETLTITYPIVFSP